MNLSSLISLCTPLTAFWILSTCSVSKGATFLIDFPSAANNRLDPFYNQLDSNGNFISGDQNSYIFDGVTSLGNVTADLSGRYYDSDPLDPGTYGLRNSNLLWNRKDEKIAEPGWLVRFGLQPDAVGSLNSTDKAGNVAPASFLSFHINSPEEVMFDSVTLVLQDIVGAGTGPVVWAATSGANFTDAIVGTNTFDAVTGQALSWTWTNMNLQTTGFDVRIYGFLGADEGKFGTGVLTGITSSPPPVPESSTSLLAGGAAMMLLTMRKRRKI